MRMKITPWSMVDLILIPRFAIHFNLGTLRNVDVMYKRPLAGFIGNEVTRRLS